MPVDAGDAGDDDDDDDDDAAVVALAVEELLAWMLPEALLPLPRMVLLAPLRLR